MQIFYYSGNTKTQLKFYLTANWKIYFDEFIKLQIFFLFEISRDYEIVQNSAITHAMMNQGKKVWSKQCQGIEFWEICPDLNNMQWITIWHKSSKEGAVIWDTYILLHNRDIAAHNDIKCLTKKVL